MANDTPRRPSSADITDRFLAFFRARGHTAISGSPLIVPGAGTSFVIAGMQPLLPYLLGREAPVAPRLTALQRCLRTDDADAVGSNARKLTAFHMLGNWSVGDYGRREAIALALELLDDFGLDRRQLWVTTFAGDGALGLPPDEVCREEWLRAGVPRDRIVPLGLDDNFWSTGGPGPCGPDTEIFVDRGAEVGCGEPTCRPGCACDRFLEIWNLVFVEYEQRPDGSYTPLPLRSVDTGMGLERVAAVLQDVPSVFDTDLFRPAMDRLAALAPVGVAGGGQAETRARRTIVDHVRATILAGLAGVEPGRDGRGSVVRGLIRRAARQGRLLGLDRPFLGELVAPLVEAHGPLLAPDERVRAAQLTRTLTDEEGRFARVLTTGLRLLARLQPNEEGLVSGEDIFALYADHGFPPDLAGEVVAERGMRVDWAGYERALEEHRLVSRASAQRRFRGG
jgi:alanyl-tRNA synthetase